MRLSIARIQSRKIMLKMAKVLLSKQLILTKLLKKKATIQVSVRSFLSLKYRFSFTIENLIQLLVPFLAGTRCVQAD